MPDDCPAFATRLSMEEVADPMAPFDASQSTWFRIFEIAVAAGFFLLPVLMFCSHRGSRTAASGFFPPGDATTRTDGDDSKFGVSDCLKKTGNDDDLPEKLPQMRCALRLLNLIDSKDADGNVIVSADGIDIGGCKMTALSGKSGCGKSTLMKLLCDFPQSHVKLEFIELIQSSHCEAACVPQPTDMWPRFMRVRDVFNFTSVMQGCNMDDFMESIKILQLGHLLDQTFQRLSGGQQQRVHVLASMIRSAPSIVFLDEPISASDEENTVACLQLLKDLPVKQAVVIAIHQMSPAICAHFDRALEIDPNTKMMRKVHFTTGSMNQGMLPPTSDDEVIILSSCHHSFF
jgi:zinc transport system ATP-binding protein